MPNTHPDKVINKAVNPEKKEISLKTNLLPTYSLKEILIIY
jgi:hypothetical protein